MQYKFFNKYDKEIISFNANNLQDAIIKAIDLKYIKNSIYVKYLEYSKIAVYYCPEEKKRYYFNYPVNESTNKNLFFVGFKNSELIENTLYLDKIKKQIYCNNRINEIENLRKIKGIN